MTHRQAASLKLKGWIIPQTLISGLFSYNTSFCLKRSMKSDTTMSLKDNFVSKISCICDGNMMPSFIYHHVLPQFYLGLAKFRFCCFSCVLLADHPVTCFMNTSLPSHEFRLGNPVFFLFWGTVIYLWVTVSFFHLAVCSVSLNTAGFVECALNA